MKSLLAMLLFLPTLNWAHQGKQAFYRLTEQGGSLVLTVKMEMPDVVTCITSENACTPETQIYWCAAKWTIEHFSIQINGSEREPKFLESRTDDGHLLMIFDLGEVHEPIIAMEVTNDCFLNSFPQYENLFQVAVKDLNQGYLMTKERTTISINTTDRS
jgi:hypothetical protein